MRTQVAIVGAGPAGLTLFHLLARAGIDAMVLESRSREHVEHRVRAGVLEQTTVELLDQLGLSARLHRERLVHTGIRLCAGGRCRRVALSELTGGRVITIYGQQELVKDLIQACLDRGGALHFGVEDVAISEVETTAPRVRFTVAGRTEELTCDFVAGCDGSQGVSRRAFPAGALTTYRRDYPFAWLGILAAVAPSTPEVLYARHDRGFALHSMRSLDVSRLYLQVGPDEDPAAWSEERIWDELRLRLAHDGFDLARGAILERSLAIHRSVVVEPMQHARLFLAGDAAHIVPPTGAKGLNLAVADVYVLSRALAAWYARGDRSLLDGYSARCLRRVWRVQQFSSWMTNFLHRPVDAGGFEERVTRAELDAVCSSEALQRALAQLYVGLPLEADDAASSSTC